MKKLATLMIYSIIIAFFICSAISCKKEKPTYYIPQEIKDYVMFPEGSYWIYEDSITGNIDSIFLLESNTLIFNPDNSSFKYEKLRQSFFSSQMFDIQLKGESYLSVPDGKFYEYQGPGKFVLYGHGITFDSLNIMNQFYYNVYMPKSENHWIDAEFYWVKHVGLIKKKYDNKNWLLKAFYINNQ